MVPSVPEKPLTLQYPADLQVAHKLIVEKKHDDARFKIEDYLNRAENIHWYGHAYFLMGFLYELDENFDQSEKYYRSAIQHGLAFESRVEAKALYNLSYVYEKTQQMDKLLVTLIDLMARRRFFDSLTAQVEIPARLAAVYAFAGQMDDALKFHENAAGHFDNLVRRQNFNVKHEEISQSLFYLGLAIFDQDSESFDTLVKKLDRGQKYFLASAEASKSIWSEKSLQTLSRQYDRAWGMIQEFEPTEYSKDPMAHKKKKHIRQLVMASDLYDLMHRIRAEEFPLANVNPRSRAIMDKTAQWIERIEKFALKLNLGPEIIRNQTIANKRLSSYIEEKEKPVRVNKEKASGVDNEPVDSKALPQKKSSENIGEDPNL